MKLRGELIQEEKSMTFPPFEMMAAALTQQGNIWAGYRKNRDDWFPEDLREKHTEKKAKAVYFAGCTVSYVEHDIGQGTVKLLDEAGVDFTYVGKKENCCGTPMLVAGKWDVFAETMKQEHRGGQGSGRRYGHHLVPRLQYDVAAHVSRVGRKSWASNTTSQPNTTAKSLPKSSNPAHSPSRKTISNRSPSPGTIPAIWGVSRTSTKSRASVIKAIPNVNLRGHGLQPR